MSGGMNDWAALAIGAAIASVGSASAEPNHPAVAAWITAEPAGVGQSFIGFVRSDRALLGRYELVAERSGPAGRSTTRQGGIVRADSGTVVQLSRASLGPLGPDDHFSVVLTVFEGDRAVARDEQRR